MKAVYQMPVKSMFVKNPYDAPPKVGMFFCQCPIIYDFWLDSQEISGKSPKILRFFHFSGCVQAFSWYNLKMCVREGGQ